MQKFNYPCPSCSSESNIHESNCDFSSENRSTIESAYIDILSELAIADRTANSLTGMDTWSTLHEECLQRLENDQRIIDIQSEKGKELFGKTNITNDNKTVYRLLTRTQWKEIVSTPTMEPLKTIYEQGSYPGCHNNAVFALIAFYEMIGLSWEETKRQVINWIHESDTWERGGFEENTPEELLEKNKYIYERGYGWKDKGEAAKSVIESHK